MEHICDYDSCSGCFACQNICSRDCIELLPDSNGELHPVVDNSKCIECGLCIKVCPINNSVALKTPNHCYAAWDTHVENRKLSASGGVASNLYSYFIKERNGVVYGVNYNAKLEPIFSRVESIDQLYSLKGSKYVQAFVGYQYRSVKQDLDNIRNVLFVGTPCQIAGLKGFLRKDYENLITVDLLCHGVPPYEYLKAELGRVKPNFQNVSDNCRFRGNDGYNYHLSLWNKDKLVYDRHGTQSFYLYGFLTAITLRESCYSCKYSQSDRVSDITIGDFLGLGDLKSVKENPRNTSVVVTNSTKGDKLWQDMTSINKSLAYEERDYSEAISGGGSFRNPAKRNVKRGRFLAIYRRFGWSVAIISALWKSVIKNRILGIIKNKK